LRRKIEKQIRRDFRSKKRKEEDNTTELIAEGFSMTEFVLLYIYIYIYIYRERERERERHNKFFILVFLNIFK
jgi:hypothetical protein